MQMILSIGRVFHCHTNGLDSKDGKHVVRETFGSRISQVSASSQAVAVRSGSAAGPAVRELISNGEPASPSDPLHMVISTSTHLHIIPGSSCCRLPACSLLRTSPSFPLSTVSVPPSPRRPPFRPAPPPAPAALNRWARRKMLDCR